MNTTTSIRLPNEVLKDLDMLANATDRNRNYLIVEAVKEFVARETGHIRRIQESLRQAEAGTFVPDQEMNQFWGEWTTPEAMNEARASIQADLSESA